MRTRDKSLSDYGIDCSRTAELMELARREENKGLICKAAEIVLSALTGGPSKGIPYYVRIREKLWGKCFRSLIYFILSGKKHLCAYQSREKGSGYIRGE